MRILLVLLFPAVFYSQIVLESTDNDVYNYIARLAQKGVILLNDEIKPLPRFYIAEKLNEAHNRWSELNNLEKDELMFFIADFVQEISLLYEKPPEVSPILKDSNISASPSLKVDPLLKTITNIDKYKSQVQIGQSTTGRWKFVNYYDTLFVFNIDPALGYGSGKCGKNNLDHFWFGANLWGNLGNNFGYSVGFENHYLGGKRYINKFSPEPGITEIKSKSRIEYYLLHFNLNYSWSWGNLSVEKEYVEWGYGKGGNLVLSKNAPSFPYFKITVSPVEWLGFSYMHGWLSSDEIDSSQSYTTTLVKSSRNVYREKYYASNTITFRPFRNFSFSLGNSVVYSDRIEVLYLIPVMLFKVADFAKYRGSNSVGDNMQYFMNFSSRNHLPNTHLYGTFFLDEFSPEIFNSESERNMFGFSFGMSVTGLPLNNLTITAEYTKIFPFVYRHYISAQTYENSSYVLGHWMEHNADQVFTSLNYRFTRGLQIDLWMHLIRKGEDGDVRMQYSRPQPPFLFGLRKYYTIAGIELKYELLHYLQLKGKFIFNKLSAETNLDNNETSHRNEFLFSLSYGLN